MASNDLQAIAARVKNDHPTSNEKEAVLPITKDGDGIPDGTEGVPIVPEMEGVEDTDEDEYADSGLAEFEHPEDESVVEGVDPEDETDDDDEPVVAGVSDFSESDGDAEQEDDYDSVNLGDDFEVTDDMIKEHMPDIPDEQAEEFYDQIRAEVESYRKKLILQSGMDPDEATAAATTRLKKLASDENIKYLKENPQALTVVVDKQNAEKFEFTSEEKAKMTKAKVIQLKVVEDTTLNTLKIKKIDKKRKLAALQSIDSNLSQYSVPLPLMNDYCRFRGAQIIQLIQAVKYNDTTLDEMINKKASMVYNQLVSGSVINKTDESGKTTMNFTSFINKFLFHDLDMALYGILVASSMEEIETDLTCSDCGQPFTWKYNLKTLLTMDDMSDEFKERFDEILEYKTNGEHLQKMYEDNNKTHIVESPITKNVYHLNYPTVARAMALYRAIDQEDETMIYLSAVALFIDKMLVYDKKSGEYIEIEEDEIRPLMEMLQNIPQEEIDIIQKYLAPMLYTPKFVLKSKCEHCGNNMRNELAIDDLVFLRARDSSTETRL
jgi:hypothetical protein